MSPPSPRNKGQSLLETARTRNRNLRNSPRSRACGTGLPSPRKSGYDSGGSVEKGSSSNRQPREALRRCIRGKNEAHDFGFADFHAGANRFRSGLGERKARQVSAPQRVG